MTDEWIIEVIAKRADDECGFSKLSSVLNHYSWVDVITHLFLEKGLRQALLDAYKDDIEAALAGGVCKDSYDDQIYREWKAEEQRERMEAMEER